MTVDLGTHPTPVRPVGVPPPPVPLPPPPPPRPSPPPKATTPTTGPDGPVNDPPPDPGPHKPNHLVDHGWRIELLNRDCDLLAEAQVWRDGRWTLREVGQQGRVVAGRDAAESLMRELAVA
jgi:hypothetical protein